MTIMEWVDEYPVAAGAMALAGLGSAVFVGVIGSYTNNVLAVLIVLLITGLVIIRAGDHWEDDPDE